MNRVAIILDANGEFSGVVADQEVEVFIVQPSCERDRVYRYNSAQFGPQYVHQAFADHAVGHMGDDMLVGGTAYGKEQPSRPKLSVVPPVSTNGGE